MPQRNAFITLVFLIQVTLSSVIFADEKLRVSAVNWPPYYILSSDSEVTGIVPDVLSEVSKRLDVEFDISMFPLKRMVVNFRNGELDIDPASSDVWRGTDNDISIYSIPYLQVQKVVFVNKSLEISGDYIQDFEGKTVATILGYKHNLIFDKAYTDKLVIRKDSKSHDTNIKLLKADRIDGVIAERRALYYWADKNNLDIHDYKEAYNVGLPIDISMRLHESQAYLLPKINRILKDMLADGFIKNAIASNTDHFNELLLSENEIAD